MGLFQSFDRPDRVGREKLKSARSRLTRIFMSSATLSSGLKKKPYTSLAVSGKRVLVRVDFNAPIDKTTGKVTDDARLRAHIPLIQYLVKEKAKTILIAHLGRPKGQINPKYSLNPVVEPLS